MKRFSSFADYKLCAKKFRASLIQTPDREIASINSYRLGPELKGGSNAGPLNCIKTYLAIKDDCFYRLKILQVENTDETKEMIQAKVLLHNEYLLLKMLQNIDNVEKCYGFFIDTMTNEKSKVIKRYTLVLEAYSDKSCENWMNISEQNHYISLQEYISRHKMVSEREALFIFYEIVKVVERIHQQNVCHRDLKIQNFLINYQTRRVKLTNFCLGVMMSSDNQLLNDQRGSPAYISPELLQGSYNGKASDMWTLGVIFYILVYQNFPFVDSTTAALFKKICQCELNFPTDGVRVSEETKKLIKNHLLTTTDRFTATETREYLERQFDKLQRTTNITSRALTRDDQIVPDIDNPEPKLICQDPPSPKYELSTENISMVLKMMSNQENNNNKMFLRPSLLAERSSRITVSPNPSGTRNLTRQINQLSVRNHQLSNAISTSWHNHNRITNSMYEIRFRPSGTERVRIQQRNAQGNSSAVTSSSASSVSTNANFEAIYNSLNELFSSGNFPNGIVHNFNGVINQDIALKLSVWLRTNFHDNPLIREIYMQASHSPGDDIGKLIDFLRRCNVEMEIINNQVFIKAQQTNQILIFLTFLLQLAGYNNNYFLNISRSP